MSVDEKETPYGLIESLLGGALVTSILARQRALEGNLIKEASVFEGKISEIRAQMEKGGVDPDKFLQKAIERLSSSN